MAAELFRLRMCNSSTSLLDLFGATASKWKVSKISTKRLVPRASLAAPDENNDNKFYKELGMFSLRKKIEDLVLRAEMLAPTALEQEETSHCRQEELVREYDLWDDVEKANEILTKLADSTKVIDTLKDLKFKAEEAKLISQLAEMDAINYWLFKQAYTASVDVNKFLDKYEMSKLLKEPYDMEGACIVIEYRNGDMQSEAWAEQLTRMYMKWAEKQGHKGRIVEISPSKNGDFSSATIEFEFKFAYGYLSGERGAHFMIRSSDSEGHPEVTLAAVDMIPLFLDSSPDQLIDYKDLIFSYPVPASSKGKLSRTCSVHIQHIPTGLEILSTGERSRFANKMKALNRLNAKLHVILRNQGICSVQDIKKDAALDIWRQEIRRYVFEPNKVVKDTKTGIQLADLNAVLNGNIDTFITAHINNRRQTGV